MTWLLQSSDYGGKGNIATHPSCLPGSERGRAPVFQKDDSVVHPGIASQSMVDAYISAYASGVN